MALDLARERALADARDVRLRDADDLVDPVRPDAEAHGRAGGDGARRGDERVRAVVEIEKRSLRTLEEDALAGAQRPIDEQRRVRDVGAEPLREREMRAEDLVEFERREARTRA